MRYRAIFYIAVFCVLGLAQGALAAPETYTLDPNHTNVLWFADHFGFSSPSGKFTDVAGTLTLDEEKPENSKLEVTIQTVSLMTGIPKFDDHLRSKDFLDVEKYPTATFVSTHIEKTGDKTAKVTGKLTLHGITQSLTLDVTLNKIGTSLAHPKKTAGFSAKATLLRSYYKMGYGIPGVSDEVQLLIETEANLADQ